MSTRTVRQPSDNPTVDLSRVFSVTLSKCGFTGYNSQQQDKHSSQWLSLSLFLFPKTINYTYTSLQRLTGRQAFTSLKSQFIWEGLYQCNSNRQPPLHMYVSETNWF